MVLVTGGTGLLGAHLLIQLTRENQPVRALYRSEKKKAQTRSLFSYYFNSEADAFFNKIEWVSADILNIPSLEKAMENISHVYHCAALVSFYPGDFNQLMKINREGTANVVNVALSKNVQKLCYVSSTAAIGGNDFETITEKTPWKNTPTTSGYSISKYSAEKEVWRAIEEGLNAVIVNPCVIIGAGNWNDSSLTIFRTLQKGMRFYPPGSNATVDARDVVEIMIQLMQSDIRSERYLCIGSNQSFKELMEQIASELNVKAPSKKVNRTLVEIARRIVGFIHLFRSKKPSITKETVHSLFGNKTYDASKIEKELNFRFLPLADSIKNAINGRLD